MFFLFLDPTALATAYGRRPKFVRAEHSTMGEGENCAYGPTLTGQPNGEGQRCAGYFNMATQSNSNGGWFDMVCKINRYSICQIFSGTDCVIILFDRLDF